MKQKSHLKKTDIKTTLYRVFKKQVKRLHAMLLPETPEIPLTMKAYRALSERCRPSDYLTYRFSDDKGVWCADNPDHFDSFLMGWELMPVIVAGEKVEQALSALLQKLPTGTTVYSMVQANADVEPYLEQWALSRFSDFSGSSSSSNEIFNATTLARAQYLIRWAKEGLKGIKSRFLSDDFRPRCLRYTWFVKIRAPEMGFSEVSERRYTQCIERVMGEVNDGLTRAGLGCRALSGDESLSVIRTLANPHLSPHQLREHPIHSNERTVREHILPSSTSVLLDDEGVLTFEDYELGEKSEKGEKKAYQRLLTVTRFPEKTPHALQMMATCIGSVMQAGHFIPGSFYAYTIIECLDKRKVLKDASLQIAWLEKQTTGTGELYRTIMREAYTRKDNIQQLYEQLKRSVPVKVISGLVMSAEDRLTLDTHVEIAKQQWNRVGLDLSEERAISIPMWLVSLPGQFQSHYDSIHEGLQRGNTLTPLNAATLTHVQGDWINPRPDQGGLLLMTRRGALSVWNIFDSLAGYNGIMAAITGAGKSFLTAEMVNDFLSRQGVVRIIDAGRSYLHLAHLVEGQNLLFQRGSGLCLNPYSHLYTESDLEEHLSMLHSVTSLMAFPYSASDVTIKNTRQFQTDFIRKSIPLVWHQLKEKNEKKEKNEHLLMSVKDIADYCTVEGERLSDQRILDIGVHLYPWAHGEYAKWVVGEANVNFDNPLVVLELDDLSNDPILQSIILSLVISHITQEMYQSSEKEQKRCGKKLPKLLIIDEAWKLLNNALTANFIEEAYRRARKYLASVWVISQSFSDAKTDSGAAIAIQQSNWIVGLMQDKGPLLQAIESHLIDLSDYEVDLIQSIHKTDLYSEVFIKNKSTGATGLYRLAVDPMTYWTYTTKAQERDQLNQLLRSGMSVKEAVEQLAGQTRQ